MSDLRETRLPGESPCYFVHGQDGWTNCAVHGWTGSKEQRSRVLVCPDAASPARATDDALDVSRLADALRKPMPKADATDVRAGVFLDRNYRNEAARRLADHIAAEYTGLSPSDGLDVLDAVFAEMAQRGWVLIPDGHSAATIRDVFIEARARLSQPDTEDTA